MAAKMATNFDRKLMPFGQMVGNTQLQKPVVFFRLIERHNIF